MSNDDESYLKRAADLWAAGNSLEAGRLIFELVPNQLRPKWAAEVLRTVIGEVGGNSSKIERLLEIADDPLKWQLAHREFSKLRELTLKLERR